MIQRKSQNESSNALKHVSALKSEIEATCNTLVLLVTTPNTVSNILLNAPRLQNCFEAQFNT